MNIQTWVEAISHHISKDDSAKSTVWRGHKALNVAGHALKF